MVFLPDSVRIMDEISAISSVLASLLIVVPRF